MDSLLLNKHQTTKYGQLTLSAKITLAKGRVHECAGRARRAFALMLAAKTSGAVLWISLPFKSDPINPSGIKPFVQLVNENIKADIKNCFFINFLLKF